MFVRQVQTLCKNNSSVEAPCTTLIGQPLRYGRSVTAPLYDFHGRFVEAGYRDSEFISATSILGIRGWLFLVAVFM